MAADKRDGGKAMIAPPHLRFPGLKTQQCYCGGWVVWYRKIDKRFKTSWKWDIWNCFPTKPDEEDIYNDQPAKTD